MSSSLPASFGARWLNFDTTCPAMVASRSTWSCVAVGSEAGFCIIESSPPAWGRSSRRQVVVLAQPVGDDLLQQARDAAPVVGGRLLERLLHLRIEHE